MHVKMTFGFHMLGETKLRLLTTQEKSSLTGPEISMVVFSHEKEEDSVKN